MKLSDTRSDMHVIFVSNLTQNAKNSGQIFYINQEINACVDKAKRPIIHAHVMLVYDYVVIFHGI